LLGLWRAPLPQPASTPLLGKVVRFASRIEHLRLDWLLPSSRHRSRPPPAINFPLGSTLYSWRCTQRFAEHRVNPHSEAHTRARAPAWQFESEPPECPASQ